MLNKIESDYLNLVNDISYFLSDDIEGKNGNSYKTVGKILTRIINEIQVNKLNSKNIINADNGKAFTDIDRLLDLY